MHLEAHTQMQQRCICFHSCEFDDQLLMAVRPTGLWQLGLQKVSRVYNNLLLSRNEQTQ